MNLQGAPFPSRPIAVRAPGTGLGSQFSTIFWALVIGGGALFFVIPPVSALFSDVSIRGTARPLPDASVEGKCSVKLVLASCDVTLVAHPPGAPEIRRQVNYLFFDSPLIEKYGAVVMADPAHPGRLTTNLGLAKLWNRLATLLVLGPLFLALAAGVLFMATVDLRRMRRLARALSGQGLRLGLLRLERWRRGRWTVVPHPSGAHGERVEWDAPGFPVLLDPDQGLVLAVTCGDGAVSMPLDCKLSFIDLTTEERQRLADWIGPERLAWRPPGFDSRPARFRRAAPAMLTVALVLGLVAAVLASLAFREPGSGDFERVDLARPEAPHSARVRLAGVLQNQLRVQIVSTGDGSGHLEEYRPMTRPGWRPGEPVEWLVKEVTVAPMAPETTSRRGTVLAGALPADALAGFRKAGVVLSPKVTVVEAVSQANPYYFEETLGMAMCATAGIVLLAFSLIGFVGGRKRA